MPTPRWKPAVDTARQALVRAATASPPIRALMERSGRELVRAAETGQAIAEARAAGIDTTYGGSYFGEGRDAGGDRAGRSGYARYDRVASNADIAGWLLWRNLRARRSLDVGCATGYLVEVLRELGIDAEGCDVSPFAIEHAAPGARGHIRVGNLFAGLPWSDGEFDLVTVLETLEHLPPDRVPVALAELRRVCGAYLYATIPSFGVNASGPDGHFEGKVLPGAGGGVPGAGTTPTRVRCPEPTWPSTPTGSRWRGISPSPPSRGGPTGSPRPASPGASTWRSASTGDIAPAGLAPYWNLYVFRVDGAPASMVEPRDPERSLAELGLEHPLLGG